MTKRYDIIQAMMKQLQKTFQDLIEKKTTFKETMKSLKEEAHSCLECGGHLTTTYETGEDHYVTVIEICDKCGASYITK